MATGIADTDALKIWSDVCLDMVHGQEPELNIRQMAILLTIYLEAPPHSVAGLATKLGVTKPVVTRALDTMGQMGLIMRRRDDRDRRLLRIQRTVKGALYLEKLSDSVRKHFGETIR